MCGCSSAYDNSDTEPSAEADFTSAADVSEAVIGSEKPLECLHYYERDFMVYTSMIEGYDTDKKILCGTVPHHLTAGRMTASFFKTAADTRDSTEAIIIIGTMHEFRNEPVVSSYLDWNAPFGTVKTDRDITEALLSEMDGCTDDDMMEADHAVSSVIPFVNYYFPDVPVASMLVSAKAADDTPERLCAALERICEEKDCLIVFSVDFSHYLSPDKTQKRDEETLKAVLEGDTDKISVMTDSNVDSAYLLNTFVRYSDMANGETVSLDHSNTLEITELPYNRTTFPEGITSYFIFASLEK